MPADFKQATNLTGKVLASGQVASAATDTTIYTVPASTATKIATFSLHNPTATAVTITKVSVLPSGGTSDGTHQQTTNYNLGSCDTITAEDVLSWAKGMPLDAGAKVVITAATAASVNFLLTGFESS
jgi:hypothetical protein